MPARTSALALTTITSAIKDSTNPDIANMGSELYVKLQNLITMCNSISGTEWSGTVEPALQALGVPTTSAAILLLTKDADALKAAMRHVENYLSAYRGKGHGHIQRDVTAAEIVALGAVTTGQIALDATLPKGAFVIQAFVRNEGAVAATLTTLTASIGTAGSPTSVMGAASVHAANAVAKAASVAAVEPHAAQALVVQFVGNANLSGLTGAANGFRVEVKYV